MITNLPKWYQVASISTINAEVLDKRSSAILNILKTKNAQWIIECIKLYLEKPNVRKDFSLEFLEAFKEYDVMFLENDFDLEKKILAGAIVSQYIEEKSGENIKIALALKSATFGIQKSDIINYDIITTALEFLEQIAIDMRKTDSVTPLSTKYIALKEESPTPEVIASHLKSISVILKNIEKNYENEIDSLKDRIQVLEEESNIHWWIFRAFSSEKNKPFAEFSGIEGSLLIAQELYEIINFIPPPPNFKHFLHILISKICNAEETKFSLEESIKTLASIFVNEPEDTLFDKYGNITPLLLGYSNFVNFEEGETWIQILEKNTGLKSKDTFSVIDIAEQFLVEYMLIKQY